MNTQEKGKEVEKWRSFSIDGQTYDLSHLDADEVEYKDEDSKIYKFFVTYGLHCFTEDIEDNSNREKLMYHGLRESRAFNFKRYELSKQLPSIIKSLGEKGTLVCHAAHGNYAVVKTNEENLDYFVVFKVFRYRKKLRIHVASAYPSTRLPKKNRVNFFKIAKSLLRNKPLPSPPK